MKDKQIKGNIEFKETQQIRQAWLWLLMASPLALMTGLIIMLSDVSKTDMVGILVLVFAMGLQLVILYLMYITRFEIAVTGDTIYYRWWPFMKRYAMLSKQDIQSADVRKSPFLQLGYKRFSIGYGRIHNAGSEKGIQFVTRAGRKIFIGSKKIKGFEQAVEKLIPVSLK